MPNITTIFEKAENWSMWEKIIPVAELADCIDEKLGDRSITTTWPPQSAFNVIINEIKLNHPNIDYVVCDDQNEEMADFVALSTSDSRCYFIHCKYKKKSLSASDFQDVCGQALKNIQYVITTNWSDLAFINKHKARWKGKWKFTVNPKKGATGPSIKWNINRLVVAPMIKSLSGKMGKATIDNFLKEFEKIISSYDGKKEVWIVQGGLSQKELREELEKYKIGSIQKEQVTQLIWFLQSTQNELVNAGAEVKIICQP